MRRLFAVALFSLCALAAGDPPRVSFWLAHRIVTDQEHVRWIVRVEPHAENRVLIVAAYDGDIWVRRTDIQLEGEHARRTHYIDWRPLPAGELVILAVVLSGTKEVARATVPVTVTAMRP